MEGDGGKGGEGAMNWLTGDCWEVRGSGGDPPLKARMDSVLGWTSALAGVYMVNCVVMTPVGGIILKPSGRLVGGGTRGGSWSDGRAAARIRPTDTSIYGDDSETEKGVLMQRK